MTVSAQQAARTLGLQDDDMKTVAFFLTIIKSDK